MFFTKNEAEKNTLHPNKYNELNEEFLSLVGASLEGIKPVKLCWSAPVPPKKYQIAYVEMHSRYTEMLENIDNFINEIKVDGISGRLSPKEKEKVIEAFIIPLYELKKTIYANAIDCIHKSVAKLQEQRHPYKYKKEVGDKYFDAEEEFNRQIHACDESIKDYKPTLCVSYCAIL